MVGQVLGLPLSDDLKYAISNKNEWLELTLFNIVFNIDFSFLH